MSRATAVAVAAARPASRVAAIIAVALAVAVAATAAAAAPTPGAPAAPAARTAAAVGDATRGAQAWETRCTGCHSIDADRIGPRHAGVFGRRAGSVAGFAYSPALRRSGLTWDTRTLDRWLADPEALVPGQRMGYRVDDAAVRADVVAFLTTLSAARRRVP